MQLGMVGLGKMGANMVRRLMQAGHQCAVTDLNPAAIEGLAKEGATGAASLADLVKALSPPRAVWVMVPAGGPTEKTVMTLGDLLSPGDTIIDGGNSWFKDDVRRAKALMPRGVHYVDAGTSGGVWGAERGYCLMVGGPKEAVSRLEPIFLSLAPGESGIPNSRGRDDKKSTAHLGYLHCGPSGAGHFVKMIHNGIEYGLMQAYAEGFDILRHAGDDSVQADHRYEFDLADVAEVWRRGSVVASWLLDLTAIALAEDPQLDTYTGFVQDSGEGRWTLLAAIEEAVPADVLSASLYARFRSRQDHTFAEKLLSAMRKQFGGHVEPPKAP
jgi:6-phosphogluconate dehydrogenase